MTYSKQIVGFLFVIISSIAVAQTKNVFLERAFWKTNPTIKLVEQKITEGHSATALNPYGFDAVVYAILEKAPNPVIKHLLTKKGNGVNKLTHDKRTYVFWAAYKGNLELVNYLINNKARLDLKDSHHFSPVTFAAATGQTNTKIYNLFIKNGIDIKNDVDENGANALLLLIPHLKDFTLVKYFTSKGLDVKSIDNNGNGVFNYTAQKGNKAMLELLIEKRFPYKQLNKNGGNAMLLATQGSRTGYNSLDFFKYLESLGINPNITNAKGNTPLHNLAYGNKNIEVFNYFINKGVDVNQVDSNGNTPLINASGRNSIEIITLLAKKTKAINIANKNGHSALTKAMNNSSKVASFLIDKGADINIIDAKGNTLGYYLTASFNPDEIANFQEKLKMLTKKGLDISKSQSKGNTLFHIALEQNNLDLLKIINNLKINVNAKNKDGLTPLHKAVMLAKDDTIIKYLLSIGVDKSLKTNFDETVYDLAKENELLKQHKMDINFLK